MNRTAFLGALLLVPLGCSFAQTANKRTPVSKPETANEVEGSFTFGERITKVTHAYARMLKNDVVILFTDNLVAQKTITDVGDKDTELSRKTKRGKVLGFYVVITPSRQVNFKIFYGAEYGGFSSGGAAFKPAVFTRSAVQGEVSTKGTFFKDEYAFTAKFKVSLRPSEWTGAFYTLPPTNLEPGRASGKLVVDGRAIALNHVYARMVHDLSGQKDKVKLTFTEVPIAEEILENSGVSALLRMKEAGNKYVVEYELGEPAATEVPIWEIGKLSKATQAISANFIFFPEVDLLKRDDQVVEGRIYTEEPNKRPDHTFELDVLFKAALSKDSPDAPVTARDGQPLPPGGGAPGQAYLQIARAMLAAKNVRELARVMKESNIARLAGETGPEPSAPVDKETENALFQLLKREVVENPRVEGGFMNYDKATLSIVGSLEGKRVSQRLNMHLEQGRWKMGASKIEYK